MIRNTSRIEIIELVSPILLLLIIITCSGVQNLKKYAFYLKPSRPEFSKAALFLTTQERLMPASTISQLGRIGNFTNCSTSMVFID